jgi:hypothetical protein
MKSTLLKKTMAAFVGCIALCAGRAQAVTIDFANETNASISFSAGTDSFTFVDGTSTFDFNVTSGGPSSGFLGNISGTFNIGAITGVGLQTAPVTGLGSLSIFDGANSFTADVQWIDIFTFGSNGGTNVGGNLNLSNFVYAGGNADLLALLADGSAAAGVSFQFSPGQSLTQLTTGTGTQSTSYSGSIASTPDGGSMLVMFGAGLLATGILRRKLKA